MSAERKHNRDAHRRAYKKWYWKNREKKAALNKVWYDKTKEARHAVSAAYLKANRTAINKRQREYAKKHPDRMQLATKKWMAVPANKEKRRKQMSARQKEHFAHPSERMKSLSKQARQRAKKLGRDFDEGFAGLFVRNPPERCACCFDMLDYTLGEGIKGKGPSIDRVDNTKGYALGNVSIICRDCNTVKRDHSIKSLEQILAYMKNHFRLRVVA